MGEKDVFDMINTLSEFIEDNEEYINNIRGGRSIDMSGGLKEVSKLEDKAIISIETKGKVESVGYEFDGNKMIMNINGNVEEFKLPEDIKKEGVEASIKNGVLEVEVPRE